MPHVRRVFTLTLLALVAIAGTATGQTIYLVTAHDGIEVHDLADFASRPKRAPDKVLGAKAVTFNITYLDGNSAVGFGTAATDSADRRARLEDALTYVADTVGATGTLDVEVRASQTDGSGALASAGTFFSDAAGFQNGSAFTRLTTGVKPFPGTPEIFVTVDFGWPWNASLSAPSGGQFDLLSVLIHEVTHGMGILSLSGSNGVGSLQDAPNTYSVFNTFMRRGAGTSLLWGLPGPSFLGNVADLTSNDVSWAGAEAVAALGGRPPINAPGTFSSGSSLSHWATGTGAIMEPSIAPNTARRTFQPFEVAAFKDIGWADAVDPGEGEGDAEGEGAEEGEGVEEGEADAPVIVGRAVVEENDRLELRVVGASSGIQWFKDGAPLGGETSSSLVFDPVSLGDSGVYVVEVNTGSKAILVSAPFPVNVVGEGALPVAGGLALAVLGLACAGAGMGALRRRK